jgi:hypothetical protein
VKRSLAKIQVQTAKAKAARLAIARQSKHKTKKVAVRSTRKSHQI